jgi:hypothetical protein
MALNTAQQFPNGARQQRWLTPQSLPHIRPGKQRPQAVAKQVACRLVAGEQQHRALRQPLGAGLHRAGGLGLHEPAHQIVSRVPAPAGP